MNLGDRPLIICKLVGAERQLDSDYVRNAKEFIEALAKLSD